MYVKKITIAVAITAVMATQLPQLMAEEQSTITLDSITVTAEHPSHAQYISKDNIQAEVSGSSDLVDILTLSPSVTVNPAGGVSGLPVMRGMPDDRLDIQLDSMPLVSSCPNHMNTPLSYVSPAQSQSVQIYPSITPVSVGGDSIGGSILVKTSAPAFSENDDVLVQGEIGAFGRSNGNAKGGNVSITAAGEHVSATYKAGIAESENMNAANDFKTFTTTTSATAGTEFTPGIEGSTTTKDEIAGTAYKSFNQSLNVAYQGADSLLQATLTKQAIPYEQYPNQRMDMTTNDSDKLNISFDKSVEWGELSLQAYAEDVRHEMAFLDYKTSTQMPMSTDTNTLGLKASAMIPLSEVGDLIVGAELQQYKVDDYWNPNPNAAGMSPNVFLNINNGTRDRTAIFTELKQQYSRQWSTRIGARLEHVASNADAVHGYHSTDKFTAMKLVNGVNVPTTITTNEASESLAFNSQNRAKTDNNISITAFANYKASSSLDIELGVARQVRSPNLYERYTWSSWSMAGVMNNFVGDGNGYVGDINLRPEVAYTLSTEFAWHDAEQSAWSLTIMPYISKVSDYIDAVALTSNATFNVLKYTNQNAQIYGLDFAADRQLSSNGLGAWQLLAKGNYTRGRNTDTDDNLYNMMPLNGSVTLKQTAGVWANAITSIVVADKSQVSDVRHELKTAGYALLNLKSSYSWDNKTIDVGVDNLLNRAYDLATGGAYAGEGNTMSITGISLLAVPGAGRSVYAGFHMLF